MTIRHACADIKNRPRIFENIGIMLRLNYNQFSLKITQGLFQSAVIPPLKIEDF